MNELRIHGPELRQLDGLLSALLKDSELIGELSLLEREHIQGTSVALQNLFPIVDARDLEDTLNES